MNEEKLKEIWNNLPTLDCQKKCFMSCGPIDVSYAEKMVILEFLQKAGRHFIRFKSLKEKKPLKHIQENHDDSDSCMDCPYLTKDKLCSIYEARPVICRLWGVVDIMKCPYGCVPQPRFLTQEEGFNLIREVAGE